MPTLSTHFSAHFVHSGRTAASAASMERHACRESCISLGSLPLEPIHAAPVHVATMCRHADTSRSPSRNGRGPNARVSANKSFGHSHAMTKEAGHTRESQPVLPGGVHERDKESEFQHQDHRPHSCS